MSFAATPVDVPTLYRRVARGLKQIGFDVVLDSTFARELVLRDHVREFLERRDARARGTGASLPMLSSACPGWICYAEKAHAELLPYVAQTKSPQQISGVLAKHVVAPQIRDDADIYHVTVMPCYDKKLEASRPAFTDDATGAKEVDCVLTTGELHDLLVGHGIDLQAAVDAGAEMPLDLVDLALQEPGGVVGAGAVGVNGTRKTAGDAAVSAPHARVNGMNTNAAHGRVNGTATEETHEPNGTATDAIHKQANDIAKGYLAPAPAPEIPALLKQPGSSSGGYLYAVLEEVWRQACTEKDPQSLALDVRVIRSTDYTDFILRDASGAVLFKGALCYGFRNLQNLVRKVQRETGARAGRSAQRGRGRGLVRRVRAKQGAADDDDAAACAPYDYVEVMACPGGCVNGGGQMRPPTDLATSQDEPMPSADDGDAPIQGWQGTSGNWVQLVEETYWDGASLSLTRDSKDYAKGAMALIEKGDGAPDRHARRLNDFAARLDESISKKGLFRTEYTGVQPETNGLAVQW